MVRIYNSRYQAGMKPGEGASINWEVGEIVRVVDGADTGRRFKVTSESRGHAGAPAGQYVREGYFVDDDNNPVTVDDQVTWAKLESTLWFDQPRPVVDSATMTIVGDE